MQERAVRVVPQLAITVTIASPPGARSYGVVANISEGGACLLTDAVLPLGETLSLELAFFREPEIVPAVGRVVWSSGDRNVGAVRSGLQWSPGSGNHGLLDLIRRAATS